MSVNGGEVLLEVFQSYGIEYIFCSPGTEWAPVWEGLAKRYSQGDESIKYINCRHESLAVSAAIGYSQATGQLSAVLLHAAVGPLNGALAIRAATIARTPIIICAGDTAAFGVNKDEKSAPPWWLSILSNVGGNDTLVNNYVKWSNTVTSKETLMGSVYRSCGIARTPVTGPVFLSIPLEYMLEEQPPVRIPAPSPAAALPEPQARDLEEVADQLLGSKQPIIITEYAGENPEAVPSLVELAELLSIPVFECLSAQFANFPRENLLHGGYNAAEALKTADTIFVVGAVTPWLPGSDFPQKDSRVIFLDDDTLKLRLPYWGYRVDLSITADIKRWLDALLGVLHTKISKSSDNRQRFEYWRTNHEHLIKTWEAEALNGQRNKPISPGWFLHRVGQILPANSIIVEETITHRNFIQRFAVRPGAYFRANGGLGVGLGTAVGSKLAHPDKPVIFFVGDGTYNYNPVLAGLGLCQEFNLPILTIVMNNGSYAAMISGYKKHYPQGTAVRRNAYLGVNITPQPDYAMIAEAFDAYGEKVIEPDEIEPALNRALEQLANGRAALLDVVLES